MKYYLYNEESNPVLCVLSPTINADLTRKEYLDPFGIADEAAMILSLHKAPGKKKTPAAEMKAYLSEEVQPV
ncbi:hypothetical protein Q5762_38250, partial [Streptomyces sp. P9(2023)]|uniref:hypothetical protein n=1 Tax=Streptomyces sp. P9(2023) TaxID=3064394 RepID=UPI0028F4259F